MLATMLLRLAGAHPRQPLLCKCPETKDVDADRKPAGPERQGRAQGEGQDPCPPRRPAEAGSVHARHDADAEEAELGPAEGRASTADERHGGRRLHPRRGAQPAGALRRADPRWPRQGPAGLPVQGHPRRARHGRRLGPQAGALEVRRKAGYLMPRRAEVQVRELSPDPVYNSRLVSQVINKVLLDGKKSTAEKIVYDALAIASERSGKPPVEVLEQAVKSVTPVLETRSRRVGGANYQVPVEVPARRARTLAIRWLVTFARE